MERNKVNHDNIYNNTYADLQIVNCLVKRWIKIDDACRIEETRRHVRNEAHYFGGF